MCIRDRQRACKGSDQDVTFTGYPLRVDLEKRRVQALSLIHISEPTRLLSISYAVFLLYLHAYDRRQRQMCIRDRQRACKVSDQDVTFTGYPLRVDLEKRRVQA